MMNRTKEGIAAVVFLFMCLFEPFPSLAQKSGALNKSAAPELLTRGTAHPSTASASDPRRLSENWIPEDIDRAVPPVAPGVACSLPAVLEGAGQRIK